MIRVLVVDDDPQIVRTLRINLHVRGFEVSIAAAGGAALRVASHHPPDVVILDLGLPDLHGTDVIHGLRGWTDVPIIVLSGRTGSADKVQALDAGADDYITKPFGIEELLARIRAVTRRAGAPETAPFARLGDLAIDLSRRRVTRRSGTVLGEDDIRLTPIEWRLLEQLIRHPGKLLSQRLLIEGVWGPDHGDDTAALRVHMGHLRRKLEPDPARPRYLHTEPGMGYRFLPDTGEP